MFRLGGEGSQFPHRGFPWPFGFGMTEQRLPPGFEPPAHVSGIQPQDGTDVDEGERPVLIVSQEPLHCLASEPLVFARVGGQPVSVRT